jgi:hypothetical protein
VKASYDGAGNHVTWSATTFPALSRVASYEIQRSDGQTFSALSSATSFDDHYSLIAGKAYLYKIVTVDDHTYRSVPSVADSTVVMTFADDPSNGLGVTAGQTTIKGIHIQELRQAIDAYRQAAGVPMEWVGASTPTGLIGAADIASLRGKLDEARQLLQLPALVYVHPVLDHMLIIAGDLNELRAGVK